MNTSAIELESFYRRQLLEDCVPFWFPRCVDTQHGGYLHCLDRDGSLVDTDKSVWAQGRIAWMLLTLYNQVEKNPQWLQWAESGLGFINDHCFDEDGRMFFHVTREGKPIRKRRYAFSESFAAIAFAAHARATGSEKSRSRAQDLFDQFMQWNFTPGLMPAKFTAERPAMGIGPRMIAMVTAQELRLNLGADSELDACIERMVEEIEKWFVKPEIECVMEQVDPSGGIIDHFDGRTLNPGHAIECAWFVLEEGKNRGRPEWVRLGCNMLDWMWKRGWDQQQGGLFYFRDVYGRPVQEYWHDMKFWWPHDEALIATLLAWQLTADSKYLRWHEQVREWSFKHFADPEYGEWYGYLHRDGTVSTTLKGNLWKSFFHHPRAMWYCWKLCCEMNRGK